MRTLSPTIALLVLLAFLPAAASAGPPFTVGTGSRPAVALSDDDGTAHIVFVVPDSPNDALRYCRVRRGATACDATTTLTLGGLTSKPFIAMRSFNKFAVGGASCCATPGPAPMYAFDSSDRGGSFGARYQVGHLASTQYAQDPYGSAPGSAVSMVSANLHLDYQRMPIDGSPPATTHAVLSTSYVYEETVGMAVGKPVVAADNLSSTATWRWSGAGDVNDSANWIPGATFAGEISPRLVDGPSGLFLFTTRTSDRRILVRRYADGTSSFGTPTDVAPAGGEVNAAQSATGELVVVWRSAHDTIEIARSRDDGATFSAPATIARDDDTVYGLQVAVAPDGQGLVVWDRDSSSLPVRAANLEPLPPPPPPGPSPSPGPVTTPSPPPGVSGPPAPSRRERTTSTLVGATVVSLRVPSGCVPSGRSFTARVVTADRRRLVGSQARVRGTRVDFLVDRVRKARDGRKPFAASLSTRGLRRGAHTVTARIDLRRLDPPRTTTRRSLGVPVSVC